MSERIKIQLTSQALHSIIGGDSEMELEIQQAIAANFAKRYLGGAINDAVNLGVAKARHEVETIAREETRKILATKYSGGIWDTPKLTGTVVQQIRTAVESQVNDCILRAAQDVMLSQEDLQARVETAVRRLFNDKVRAAAELQISKHIDAALEAIKKR